MRRLIVCAAAAALLSTSPAIGHRHHRHGRCHHAACWTRVAYRRITSSERAWLERTARCESGGDYTALSPGGRYRGRYQFDVGSWGRARGPYSNATDPARAGHHAQDVVALRWRRMVGRGAWPVCG